MRKPVIFIICLLILIFVCAAKKPRKICFQNTRVLLEIADSELSRAKGLMFRKELAKNSGMLFIYPVEGIYQFWMKNTVIPLDIIWLDKNLRVVSIKSFAFPCKSADCPSYNPQVKARYILEVNAGFSDYYQIKINDQANFNYF